MPASYPGAIKVFTDQVDGVDDMDAVDVNAAYDEIEAIEAELGTLPKGLLHASVKALLAATVGRLEPAEQTVPVLTIQVAAGLVYVSGNMLVDFAGGNSPSFTAPTTNPRIDLLTLNSSGTLERTAGTEAASPTPPTYPTDKIVICEVFNRVGQTKILNVDDSTHGYISKDVRPLLNLGVTGPATKAKWGQFGRDTTLASGNQAVTGVGFKPVAIYVQSQQSATTFEQSWGIDTGVARSVMFLRDGLTYQASQASSIFDAQAFTNHEYKGKVQSMDTDGFTIVWTKLGSPTGTLENQYLAIG